MDKRKRRIITQSYYQKSQHPQKNPKSNATTQKMPPKTLITQRLRTDTDGSDGVKTATPLVSLNLFNVKMCIFCNEFTFIPSDINVTYKPMFLSFV